jgi:hypothetical protein
MNPIRLFFLVVWVSAAILAGCAAPLAEPEHQTALTKQEKGWITKAWRQDKNGWIFLHIEGKPFERGFQRGYLTAGEIDDFYRTLAYITKFETSKDVDFFIADAWRQFHDKVSPEYVEEMRGMVAGMNRAGKTITYKQMLFLASFNDICYYWWPREKERIAAGCSAFIAAGDATAGGKIVMAQNTWGPYSLMHYCNLIIDIVPDRGHRILMQAWGAGLFSALDFFVTDAGLMGTETTIDSFKGYREKGKPIFERARRAMQYADTIDAWSDMLIRDNNGALANSWLIGDIKTGEIACLDLGLKHHRLTKKTSGYFTGSNIPEDREVLLLETSIPYDDIRNIDVSRRERWKQLMKQYYGKIDLAIAKRLLADHYDVYLEKENPCARTLCGHSVFDDGRITGSCWPPYYPGGAVDGKVMDSDMANRMRMWTKWGSSCDIRFNAQEFLEKHTQFDWLNGYLKDMPVEPWTVFPSAERN